MDNLTLTLPSDKHERYLLKRHLLFDDDAQVLFCWVEKIGCTELKRMFAVHKGMMPVESISWSWQDEPMARQYLFPLYASFTLANKNLTDESRIHRMKKYYKMMIVRNPLERLLSGYLNKIRQHQQPAQGEFPFPLDVKRELIARYHPTEYQLWLDSNYSEPIISFPEFVQYIVDTEWTLLNSHFKPMTDVCHPCRVRYDFYGSFKNLYIDGLLLADRLGAKREYFRNKPAHRPQDSTNAKLKHYFSQLHYDLKKRLLMHWWTELDFYYHVYPEERHSHKELLDIDMEL